MRRKDREIVDINEIVEIIKNSRYMHLGVIDGKYPYVVPLHYGYQMKDGRLSFYAHSANEGRKLDCIKENNRVFVEIDRGERLITANTPCKFGAEYESVMGRGIAELVSDLTEKRKALELIMKTQTGKEYVIDENMLSDVSVIKIKVENYTAKKCMR